MDEGYDAINIARAYDIAALPPARRPAARGDDPARKPGADRTACRPDAETARAEPEDAGE